MRNINAKSNKRASAMKLLRNSIQIQIASDAGEGVVFSVSFQVSVRMDTKADISGKLRGISSCERRMKRSGMEIALFIPVRDK